MLATGNNVVLKGISLLMEEKMTTFKRDNARVRTVYTGQIGFPGKENLRRSFNFAGMKIICNITY